VPTTRHREISHWPLLLLLAVSVLINYMDRGNLSVAAPALSDQLSLRPEQMGALLSAFFWTYASFQLVAGWLVDRYDVTRVYALGYLVWSVATLAIGLAGGFAALLALRLLLGIGESVAYPAYSKMLSVGFKEEERGLANGVIDAATKFGPAIGTYVGAWMIDVYGWRSFFVVTGGVSLVWLIPWMLAAPKQAVSPAERHSGPGWGAILSKRAAWATFLGLFCHNYNWYFLLTWLPSYLVRERHFSMSVMAFYSALPLCATALATISGGWISDRMIQRGSNAGQVRRSFLIAGVSIPAVCLPFVNTPDHVRAMSLLVVAFIGIGIYTSNCWALTQSMAGPEASGRWTGLQNAVGNLGGVVAPAVTGVIVGRLGSFRMAFLESSAVLALGAVVYVWMLGRVRPIEWEAASPRTPR